MRTRALTITVGKYRDGSWHTALTESLYEGGRLMSTSLTANRWTSETQVLDTVARALQHAMDMESARIDLERLRGSGVSQEARRARA